VTHPVGKTSSQNVNLQTKLDEVENLESETEQAEEQANIETSQRFARLDVVFTREKEHTAYYIHKESHIIN
jgi:hypothetical protein